MRGICLGTFAVLWAALAAGTEVPRRQDGQFRGGPERSGDFGGVRLPDRADVLWTFEGRTGFSSPVVDGGVVYVGARDGTLFALDADDGTVLWKKEQPGRDLSKPPLVAGERVYAASNLGLTALARVDGSTLWHYPIRGGAAESSPLLVGGRVVVAGYDGYARAVDAEIGRLSWAHDLVTDAPAAPPGFDQRRAVIGGNAARPGTCAGDGAAVFVPVFDQSRVVAVDAATGDGLWSFQTKGWTSPEPTVAGDLLFQGSQDDRLYALDRATGRERWSFQTRGRVESGAGVRGGGVFFGSCDGFFYRVDAKTGRRDWTFETARDADGKHEAIYSSPVVTDDAVCFGSFDGYLYALEAATGTLKWKVRPVDGSEVDSTPCATGRRVFVSVRARLNGDGANAVVAVGERPAR